MRFYDLSKEERELKYKEIQNDILNDLKNNKYNKTLDYFNDDDTYIRKAGYIGVGKLYNQFSELQKDIILFLNRYIKDDREKVRQTIIYCCGEIAVTNFEIIENLIKVGITDKHHSVKNASTGALKKAGEKNPKEIIKFCSDNITSENPEIRKLMCHSLELRGRTHPEEIINILKILQCDKDKKVFEMLIHVLGQISYKKGCFHFVEKEIRDWDNKDIYPLYKDEVIEVHGRYEKFSEFKQEYIIDFFFQKAN